MRKSLIPAGILLIAFAFTMTTALKARDDHDDNHPFEFKPGTLVLTRSVYTAPADLITPGVTLLPPGCTAVSSTCAYAVSNAEYANDHDSNNVFNNDAADGSFGVSSPILLDNLTLDGHLIDTLHIPTDRLVTSFSSKSELALNRSVDGKSLTFMGYVAPVNAVDISASNTPGIIDPTDPVLLNYYRAVGEIEADGRFHVTETNAYSGDNSRAAIKADWTYYTVGNSNNGTANPTAVTSATGVELIPPFQAPVLPPYQIGTFSITQYYPTVTTDKPGKDDNFRGVAVNNNTLYVTKGSGSNGINTVYMVGCPGVLPTLSNAPGTCAPAGTPAEISKVPITIPLGFPTARAKTAGADNVYPFGMWFANDTTLYLADEGDGSMSDVTPTVKTPLAGLQKWSLVGGTWQLDYTLQNGLDIGVPYSIDHYPTSLNPATGGLRNLTGQVNHDGTVTIWAVTATVSANPDQGADPNKLVMITDDLSATSLPASEKFVTIREARAREVFRGIAFAPTDRDHDGGEHDDSH